MRLGYWFDPDVFRRIELIRRDNALVAMGKSLVGKVADVTIATEFLLLTELTAFQVTLCWSEFDSLEL